MSSITSSALFRSLLVPVLIDPGLYSLMPAGCRVLPMGTDKPEDDYGKDFIDWQEEDTKPETGKARRTTKVDEEEDPGATEESISRSKRVDD